MPAIDYLSTMTMRPRRGITMPHVDRLAGNSDIDGLTRSQKTALEVMLSGEDCFLNGGAGTGKSHLVEIFRKYCGKGVIMCAPTGVAALNIGATTIHSLFGMPVKSDVFNAKDADNMYWRMRQAGKDDKQYPLIKADVLIVDEISMCRGDTFSMIMAAVRGINDNETRFMDKDRKNLQLIVVGDFHQLPPVLTTKQNIQIKKGKKTIVVSTLDRYREVYGNSTGYAFLCDEWNFRECELKDVVRQADSSFATALNKLRIGDRDGLSWIENNSSPNPIPDAMWICGTNARADQINRERINALPGRTFRFHTEIDIKDNKIYQDEDIQHLASLFGRDLALKEGCRVVATANSYRERKLEYANGMTGTVIYIDTYEKEPVIHVRFDRTGEIAEIRRKVWEITRPVITVKKKKETVEDMTVATVTQYPLLLGYATTVHKSQGKTLDAVNIDANCNFMPGQLYVAISRCRDVKKLYLERKGMIPKVSSQLKRNKKEMSQEPAASRPGERMKKTLKKGCLIRPEDGIQG